MCFTLYIGTEGPLPEIKWDEANPGFNSSALDEDEKKVRDRFSLPEVNCLGADTHCGCGFRHALLDGKDWFPIISENEKDINDEKKNHQELFDYIISNVKKGRVELFGCWNGDGHEEPLSVTEITCLNLLDDNFYFKERGFYYFVIR